MIAVMTFSWFGATGFDTIPPRSPGSYLLLVRLEQAVTIKAGRLPDRQYAAGWYVYAGSAMNGLKPRLTRYLKTERKRHWHIDYLLEHGEVTGAWMIGDTERRECALATGLRERFEWIPGFGSTDCRCPGHLVYCADEKLLRKAVTLLDTERSIEQG